MDKPLKPRTDNFSEMLGRLFRSNKIKSAKQPGQSNQWQTKANTIGPVKENPPTDPFLRFRTLSSDKEAYNPTTSKSANSHPTNRTIVPHFVEEPPLPVQPGVSSITSSTPESAPKRFFQLSKTLPAFWTVASLISLGVNVVLIVALVLLARELFVLKALVGNNLLGGLYENFIYMDQAHIKTNITVQNTIPINFTLPISQDTSVTLTRNTPIRGANVTINTGGISINSPANIVLPAGTTLPVHLDLQVPVSTNVPVELLVPVDIPLNQTDLHKPFIGLQQVVSPFYYLLQPQVRGPQDLTLCSINQDFCSYFFK